MTRATAPEVYASEGFVSILFYSKAHGLTKEASVGQLKAYSDFSITSLGLMPEDA